MQPACSIAGAAKSSSLASTPVTAVCVDRSLTFTSVALAQLLGVGVVPVAVTATVRTGNQCATSSAGWAVCTAVITMGAIDQVRHINSPLRCVAEHRDGERPQLQGGRP